MEKKKLNKKVIIIGIVLLVVIIGIVLFLVINGRLANSIGADMIDLTDIMENYGAINAANLDGGSSSELVIHNKIINTPVAGGENGLRNMPTFWIVK